MEVRTSEFTFTTIEEHQHPLAGGKAACTGIVNPSPLSIFTSTFAYIPGRN
jgi:hypothetical protein